MTTGWGNQYVSMWVDFNDDNVFSSDELILVDEIVNDCWKLSTGNKCNYSGGCTAW